MLLTVIIPTRNRSARLADLLDSLSRLEPSGFDWEVVVVDNDSSDDTAGVVRRAQRECPIAMRYVFEPRPGLHQGRHRGAREARADLLAYLDDDMVVSAQWLSGVRLLLNRTADVVVGRILPQWGGQPPAWLSRMAGAGAFGYLSLLDLGESAVRTEHFYACNLFIPKRTVLEAGGFHPDGMPDHLLRFRGDGETGLWLKLRAAAMSLWYEPTALAHHVIPPERMTLAYLRERAYRQGISASFTDLRNTDTRVGTDSTWRLGLGNLIAWIRRQELYRLVRHGARRLRHPGATNAETRAIQLELSRAWARGWAFHRAAVRRDPSLRAHVLRRTFLDSGEGAPE